MDDLNVLIARLGPVSDVKALLEGLFAFAPVAFQIYTEQGHSLAVNQAFRDLFRSEPPPTYSIFEDEIVARQGYAQLVRRAFAGETISMPPFWYDPRELTHVKVVEARRVAIQVTLFPLRDAAGVVRHVGVCAKDVTSEQELKVANEEIGRKSDRLRMALEAGRMITVDTEVHAEKIHVSENACEVLGLPPGTPLETMADWKRLVPEDERASLNGVADRIVSGEIAVDRTMRLILPQSGERRWIERRGQLSVEGPDGGQRWIRGIAMDVTERVRAEEALRISEARYRTQFELAPEAILTLDVDRGTFVEANRSAERLFGRPREELLRLTPMDVSPPFQADGRSSPERATLHIAAAMGGGEPQFEWNILNAAGEEVPCEVRVIRLPDSTARLCRASIVDVSERKHAEAERRRLEQTLRETEEQLRQSQKMEAIGRLAGGIAHDFNNLLSVVLGYSDMLLASRALNDAMTADVREIRSAAERAAQLTGALLAFSRQQVLEPVVLDLNDIVRRMDKMLRRLIGEDIDLRMRVSPSLGIVKVDPGQIEQVILNLAVNARDAMPNGGILTVETANVELDGAYAREHPGVVAGPHVMMAVTDTGVGMSRDVQAKIFEPFFTTKDHGKGTGLGLATVFGIVRQSGGNIWVYSEPGNGTTFKLYFPQSQQKPDAKARAQGEPVRLTGTETVLLVEDEEALRTLASTILIRSGYRVIAEASPLEALAQCERFDGTIDLLITDVVMPQMNGREMAERASRLRRGLRVLYVSGYTDHTIVHNGALEEGVAFLPKPITPDLLLRKVREVLASPPPDPLSQSPGPDRR